MQHALMAEVPNGPEGPQSTVESIGTAWWPDLAPNGRWFASTSPDVKTLFLQSIENQRRIPLAADYAVELRWCESCGELFYRKYHQIFSIKVQFDPEIRWEKPTLAFELDDYVLVWGQSYDISADGQRALYVKRTRELPRDQINVIQNWTALLEAEQ